MRLRSIVRVLAGLMVVALANGAAASARAEATRPVIVPRPSPGRYACLRDVARRVGVPVEVDELTGVHRLRRGDHQVAVVPGVAWALVGSELRTLDDEVVVRYGRAYVPLSLVSRIERLFRRHEEPSPRPTPSRPTPPGPPSAGALGKVCIDPGHGGRDPGAVSRWGLKEKDVVLPTARLLASVLRQRGFEVSMTRESDAFIELEERPAIAERQEADLFVSVHANAISKPQIHGIEIFYCRLGEGVAGEATRRESAELAETLRRAFEREGLEVRSVRAVGYRVLKFARMPAVLVELGFLTNLAEERLLRTYAYRRRLVDAIADGLEAYRRKNPVK